MAATVASIQFHYLDVQLGLKNRNILKGFVQKLLKKEGRSINHINYIFCNDAYLLQINKSYLDHDTLTDIITFELSPQGDPLVADIFISVERVIENAGAFKTRFQEELHRVIFHGALHLAGYNDKSKKERELMRSKEEFYLDQYFRST